MTKRAPSLTERVQALVDRAAVVRGEAQWVDGYRTRQGPIDQEEWYLKSRDHWRGVDAEQRAVVRALVRMIRAAERGKP
jgi:hypothetical protein